jgi:FAD/FMN-containing dehydrogenase
MEEHTLAVNAISKAVRRFHDSRRPFRIYHGSTNSTRHSQRSRDNTVDITTLNRILSIDKVSKTAIVEPNVPMDALVKATLEHGLVPPVVMEFPGITVGGGFSGTSGESSSFRYGAFDATTNWIEIVIPTGEVLRASKTDKPDLFWDTRGRHPARSEPRRREKICRAAVSSHDECERGSRYHSG